MKSYVGLIIIICFFAALIAGFFILKNSSSGSANNISFATTTVATSSGAIASPSDLPPPSIPDGYKEYRNEQFGLSVYYPQELTPKEYIDRGPELTVVFQAREGEPGFQIYAAPIDGTKITPERFQRDAPSGIRLNPHDTQVAGAQAVEFQGFDAKIGKTYEVWFIHPGPQGTPAFLYEVSTYKELDQWLSGIMKTWRFISSGE